MYDPELEAAYRKLAEIVPKPARVEEERPYDAEGEAILDAVQKAMDSAFAAPNMGYLLDATADRLTPATKAEDPEKQALKKLNNDLNTGRGNFVQNLFTAMVTNTKNKEH